MHSGHGKNVLCAEEEYFIEGLVTGVEIHDHMVTTKAHELHCTCTTRVLKAYTQTQLKR